MSQFTASRNPHPNSPKMPSPDRTSDFVRRRPRMRHMSWSEPFSGDRADHNEALKNIIRRMRLLSFSNSGSITPRSESSPESEIFNASPLSGDPDYTASLSDELLLKIFYRFSDSKQHLSNSLVCKRWCFLSGKLIKSIRLLDWDFLESGRLTFRFPNLVDVNIVPSCIRFERNSGILLTIKSFEVFLNSRVLEKDGSFVKRQDILCSKRINEGLRILGEGCKNLRKVTLINVGEEGVNHLGNDCDTLQEMELHNCDDFALQGIEKCRNLQILKVIGRLTGVYESVVSDIGMTILAQGCRRLLKLQLVGCEGSYDGIKAIGMCCLMLAEMTISDHRMEDGWLSALSYCANLKILRIESCKYVDGNPGPNEHLRPCSALEELHLTQCQLRDKQGVRSLFLVCREIRGLVIEDCWGLRNNIFAAAVFCRKVRSLSMEGCSLLTAGGLEAVLLSWEELDSLKIVSCNNMRASEITAELATCFSGLKELKWRPDTRSILSTALKGTGIGQGGGKYIQKL